MRPQLDRPVAKRVDPLVMKSLNAIELLDLIRQYGPVSRSALAKVSRLSKPTVSGQVDALIAKKLVVEVGTGEASARGGKKPTLLEFHAGYGRIYCVEVGPEWVRFVSADLLGRAVAKSRLPTRPEAGSAAVLHTVERGVADLLSRDAGVRKLTLISAAVPGIVDVRRGVVIETDNVFGWRDLAFAEKLRRTFDVPIHVDNDVNMAALAELNAGGSEGLRDFILIRLNTGIGAGVVLNGALHHGAHWASGEISHMVLDTEAAHWPPNPRGFLESIVGVDRVKQRIGARIHKACADPWSVLEGSALDGNDALGALRQELIDHLGCAAANLAAVFDPDAIILLGEAFPKLIDSIRKVASKLVPWPLDIRLSSVGEDASLQGALAAGLQQAYAQIAGTIRSEGLGNGAGSERFFAAISAHP